MPAPLARPGSESSCVLGLQAGQPLGLQATHPLRFAGALDGMGGEGGLRATRTTLLPSSAVLGRLLTLLKGTTRELRHVCQWPRIQFQGSRPCQRFASSSGDASHSSCKLKVFRGLLTVSFGVFRAFGTVREDGSPVHCWEAETEVLEALARASKVTICRAAKGNTTQARRHNHNCGFYDPTAAPPRTNRKAPGGMQ